MDDLIEKTTYYFCNDPEAARTAVRYFISLLPKPEAPYEQAILYRKLVGMDE